VTGRPMASRVPGQNADRSEWTRRGLRGRQSRRQTGRVGRNLKLALPGVPRPPTSRVLRRSYHAASTLSSATGRAMNAFYQFAMLDFALARAPCPARSTCIGVTDTRHRRRHAVVEIDLLVGPTGGLRSDRRSDRELRGQVERRLRGNRRFYDGPAGTQRFGECSDVT